MIIFQEIAKRYEKYQGRYHTSSSRCNTPLPLVSADSIDSIHSNSVTAETSEKIVLFRQCLENDRYVKLFYFKNYNFILEKHLSILQIIINKNIFAVR